MPRGRASANILRKSSCLNTDVASTAKTKPNILAKTVVKMEPMCSENTIIDVETGRTPHAPKYTAISNHQYIPSPSLFNLYDKTPQAKRKLELDASLENYALDFLTTTPRKSTPLKAKRQRTTSEASVALPTVVTSAKSPGEKRYDTSLGILTKKFVSLLTSSPDGILDLNNAAETLEVQKRRIYDITNVLEGINLIRKKSKNNIQWKGALNGEGSSYEQTAAEREIKSMKEEENRLDELIRVCSMQLKHMTQDHENEQKAYITYQDLRKIESFKDDTVIAIKAPPETRLEVPDPKERIQIWLKSRLGPIEVFLCADDKDKPSPVKSTVHDTSLSSLISEDSRESHASAQSSIRNALLEDQDISHEIQGSLFLQTIDQQQTESDLPINPTGLSLEPPLNEEDYMFVLDNTEDLAELFDCVPPF